MIVAGLTGNFGAGKTEASELFQELGALVIDADKLGHQCLEQNNDCIRKIKRQFGYDVVTKGKIDRKKLGNIVFEDKESRKKLEKIVHPYIRKKILAAISDVQRQKNGGVFIIEAALLIEAGWHKWVDKIILVKSTEELQIKRIQRRSNIPRVDILKRLQAQYAIEYKLQYADYVIDNRSTRSNLKKQVKSIYDDLIAFY